ncbi:MAG: cobalamin B12-binding domain-containing protein [Betaproteobacteria bacterium]|nr:cobalamin B12-binding domain-containing protein [Betaproteobacteria bacterium]
MIHDRKINQVMLIFPPGKVYIYPDGSAASRKHCSPPIGIAYLAANLLRHGYQACCLDMTLEMYEREVYHSNCIRYGMQAGELIERIRQEQPDVIGISVLFSMFGQDVLDLCVAVKAAFPDKIILLGGQHCTGAPFEMMNCPAVDYVLLGEADTTIIQLMQALNGERSLDSVTALIYRRPDGSAVSTMVSVKPMHEGQGWNYYKMKESGVPHDLDELPYPAWHLFNMEGYWQKSVRMGGADAMTERYGVMFTSRGCPHICGFCTSPLSGSYRGYRTREIESVTKEIRWLRDTYGVREIQFVEDNLFVHRKRAKQLLRVLGQEFPDMVFWNTGGVEANALDFEMINLMAEANFRRVILAVEAGDEVVQKNSVDKHVNLDRLPENVRHMQEKGIDIKALYMIGFPHETRAQIDKTVALAKSLGVLDFALSIVTPLPGTPLWDQCQSEGLFLEDISVNDINFGKASIRLPDTTPEELEGIRRTVWLEAFQKRQALAKKKQDALGKGAELDRTHEEYQGFRSIRTMA